MQAEKKNLNKKNDDWSYQFDISVTQIFKYRRQSAHVPENLETPSLRERRGICLQTPLATLFGPALLEFFMMVLRKRRDWAKKAGVKIFRKFGFLKLISQ